MFFQFCPPTFHHAALLGLIASLVDAVLEERDLRFEHSALSRFVLTTSAPPRAVHAHLHVLELKALAAENVEVDFTDHVRCGRNGLS